MSKAVKAMKNITGSATCDHCFEFIQTTVSGGVVGKCSKCRTRFTAWPGWVHYDEIKAAKEACS